MVYPAVGILLEGEIAVIRLAISSTVETSKARLTQERLPGLTMALEEHVQERY